ncbi:39S ribosomal protein L22, mitochondrial [Caenorhabditis elegans]|uniref:39S ribosomal protein L22, mitochondrial n=1 Tax=Caenorhabditis elegans TaxID=6239 RepID=Q22363_CAEEL|nr:39S ribosomal protein L22, mitochondrial [Caenorhabditis elegans]CAA88871.2 39S ribosomal protein L22, mitochondrial [Caenorhabditis elegans]|eukprot:NP_496238.2 Uncharacterized protein CELE_T09F3.4 [Caenorhabditis elegans]
MNRVLARFCSSIPSCSQRFTEEELQAIIELKRRSERILDKAAQNVLKGRSWAKAPVLEVSGRKPPASWQRSSKKGQRFFDQNEQIQQSVVKLRWADFAERDVDVLLTSQDETLYTVEVKAVLYGIIQAIHLNETKIRMKSANEVVVRVANKRYTASKEAASFHLITRVVNGNDTKSRENQLKAKLETINEPEKPIKRIAKTTISENDFFQKYRNSIELLKKYS